MAYRRRQGMARASTFKEEIHYPPDDPFSSSSSSYSSNSNANSSSLAAQAIRASAAHRESSLSSAYGDSAFSYANRDSERQRSKVPTQYEYTSLKSTNEPKGFWGVLARKAKAILDDDEQFDMPKRARPQMVDSSTGNLVSQPYQSPESIRRMDNPKIRKGLDAITSSLNHIGGTIGNAFEEGRTIVENKTADIIQETRKLQIRRKGGNFEAQNQVSGVNSSLQQPLFQPAQPQIQNQETQLKASRDVAMATAAKAKLLLRELKTVKADLAFAKERCAQLEEENKILRESREKGDNPADDDLIRLQLETLLAEKARLAHENSVYARENRFLREIVEYHQLTMQDVVYLDEGIEEVTEVYPISRMLSVSPPSPMSPSSAPDIPPSDSPPATKEIYSVPIPIPIPIPVPIKEIADDSRSEVPPSSSIQIPEAENAERHSTSSA
ncbi:uncharacterized protein LOC131160328 [Malania oleifera]|uniref:uncharacterized protein LOC131160328 n=1 Tax=Malania oleifera TaxID=397392 RepID=UPI0025ADE215|nr:uncharacterized protein LOC131160328 [Malania oleifera]